MITALTVADSDSIGGGGIQADVKAMSVIGIHATSVITAITVRNTCGLRSIFPLSEDLIQDQLEIILNDCDIKAIKTGMLYSANIVKTVSDIIDDHEMPLVVDPIMTSIKMNTQSKNDLIQAIKKRLLPICELITPNKYEAEVLSDVNINSRDDAMLACEIIGKQGSSVLLKGGQFRGSTVIDYLYLSSEFTELEYPRLYKPGYGGGCILSSFITANMAKGSDTINAVIKQRDLIQGSIQTQYLIGKGVPIVNTTTGINYDISRSATLDALDLAAYRLMSIIPIELVPKSGLNIVLALENANKLDDVASIDNGIIVHNGILKKNGLAMFGHSKPLSCVILNVMKYNRNIRCAMSVLYNNDTIDTMEEIGMSIISIDMDKDKMLISLDKELSKIRYPPDAIIYKKPEGVGVINILAKDTDDMINKIEDIL